MKKTIDHDFCRNFIKENIFGLKETPHSSWPGLVGLEVEMFAFLCPKKVQPELKPFPHYGEQGSTSLLLNLAKELKWEPIYDKDVLTYFKLEEGDTVSFEPGGQIEISTAPHRCLRDTHARLNFLQNKIIKALEQNNGILFQGGIDPWNTTSERGLQVPKKRYKAMDAYFNRIGPFGQRMMRQTGTIQVCIDFGSTPEKLVKRYLASQLLSPFCTALFCNSPFADRIFTKKASFRSHIWKGVDPSRTGFVGLKNIAKNLTIEACVDAYTTFALEASVIFIENLQYEIPTPSLSFSQWLTDGYSHVCPTEEDFKTHLSLLFPEVRPKGFLEIRSIDAQARTWQSVPGAFITGLLYDSQSLDKTLDLLLPCLEKMPELWIKSADGLADPLIGNLGNQLMKQAIEGFERLPPCFQAPESVRTLLKFYEHYTFFHKTPANELLEAVKKTTTSQTPTYNVFLELEETHKNFISK